MHGFTPPFRHMSSWHGEQDLLHFYMSYKLLELLRLARPKDVAVVRFISLTLRRLMSYIYIYIYIYGAPILDVSRSHTTTQHSP